MGILDKLRGSKQQQPTLHKTFVESPIDQVVLNKHFEYSEFVRTNYSKRNSSPDMFAKLIAACESQIDLAPSATAAFKRDHEEMEARRREYERRLGEKPQKPRPFSLPAHVGFFQLAIIREKEGNLTEAIRLSRVALQQGWDGDWVKRIARLEAKVKKRSEPA